MTLVISIHPQHIKKQRIRHAATLIKQGGIVVFPTETVYGLGADAFNGKAIKKIFTAKGRPSNNPLIVHIATYQQLHTVAAHIPHKARTLIRTFWPGPLTLILKKAHHVPKEVTAGLNTVAVRIPNHPIALALIKQSRTAIAAPSANLSGKPSPTTAAHVFHDMNGKVDCIINGGTCKIGVESTILDMTVDPPLLLRPGGISIEQIEKILKQPIAFHPAVSHPKQKVSFAKAPGMKYRHYAPKAQLILVEGKHHEVISKMDAFARMYKKKQKKVGIIRCTSDGMLKKVDATLFIGNTPQKVAHNLFTAFRTLDHKGMHIIIAEGIDEKHIGLAVMNRMRKAASRIIRV